MIGQIQAGADGRVGLVALAVGFILQAGGYVALIARASVQTGGLRAGLSVALAVLAAIAWWSVLQRVHSRIVNRLVVDVVRANPVSGELRERPDGGRLLALGQELGFLLSEAPVPGNRGVLDRYAQRYFRVDRVENHLPNEAVGRGPVWRLSKRARAVREPRLICRGALRLKESAADAVTLVVHCVP
jgi:hypothetical protein